MDRDEPCLGRRAAVRLVLFPEVFAAVSRFHERHGDFVDETLSRFDRDVASYLAYLRLVERLHRDGLPFCLPEHVVDPAEAYAREGFDIVLADGRHGTPGAVVCDDFRLGGPERLG